MTEVAVLVGTTAARFSAASQSHPTPSHTAQSGGIRW